MRSPKHFEDSPSRKSYIADLHRYLARVENIFQQPLSPVSSNQDYTFQFDMSERQSPGLDDLSQPLSPESSFLLYSANGHNSTSYHSYETPKPPNSIPAVPTSQTLSMDAYWRSATPLYHSQSPWFSEHVARPAYGGNIEFPQDLPSQQLYFHTPSTTSSASPAPSTHYGSMNSASPYQQAPALSYSSPRYAWQPSSSGFRSVSPLCGSPEPNEMPCRMEVVQSDDENHKLPYNELLFQCLMESDEKALPLQDIYDWFVRRTGKRWSPSQKGWQNSVRHNLSQNEAFVKGSRNSRAKAKKTMWCLSDAAIAEGKVWPTTRFRKNTDRQSRNIGSPAPQRQISGSKGGHAARRSARLKHRKDATAKITKHEHSSVNPRDESRSATPIQNSTPTPPNLGLPSRHDVEQLQQNETVNRPYYDAPSRPIVPSLCLGDIPQQYIADHSKPNEASSQLDVYMGHVELHSFSGTPEPQSMPNYFDTSSLSRNGLTPAWYQQYNSYSSQAMDMRQQALHRQAMERRTMQHVALQRRFKQQQDMQQHGLQRQSAGLSMELDLGMSLAALPTSNTPACDLETRSLSQQYANSAVSSGHTRYDTPLFEMQMNTGFERDYHRTLPASSAAGYRFNDEENEGLVMGRSIGWNENWGQEAFLNE